MNVSINPVWLNSFIHLVKTESFTKTAESLHMTQPGVSQHIKKLESFFDGEIIDRNAKSFSITPLGKELYTYGQVRYKSESELVHRLKNWNEKVSQIKLFVDRSLYPFFFTQHFSTHSDENRKKLKIISGDVKSVINAMDKGDCDAGFLLSTQRPESAGTVYIGDVEFGVICKKGHFPSSAVTLDSLNKLGMVSYPDMGQESLLEDLATNNLSVSGIPHACHAETICAALLAVSLGTGFTLMPKFHFVRYHDRDQLHFFPLAKHKQLYYLKKDVEPEWEDEIKIEDMLTSLIFKSNSQNILAHNHDVIKPFNLSIHEFM